MIKAYSYIRFSTPEQKKGSSLKRQQELAADYAQRHGLVLDDSKSYHDLGVSGFKGDNRDAALGAFINAVKKGDIETGSFLLVESLDRLSRDKILKALAQLSDIINLGITVVTLQDRRVFDSETIGDLGNLIVSLTIMSRANEESEVKAKRLRDAWSRKKAQAREGNHKLTRECPGWLYLTDNRDCYELIEHRAVVVQRIFRMTLDGIGYVRIAQTLNEEEVPVFGRSNGWHHSYIQKILQNEAVIGVYQPMRNTKVDGKRKRLVDGEPISNYYPVLIDRGDFLQVQAMKTENRKPRGRTGKVFSNLLSGLVECGSCGGSMQYVGRGKPPKGRPYLTCANSRRSHECNVPSWRYEPIEAFIVSGVAEVDLSTVFPEKISLVKDRLTALKKKRLGIAADKQTIDSRLKNAVNVLLDGPSDAIRSRVEELETENREADGALVNIDIKIEKLQRQVMSSNQDKHNRGELLKKWNATQEETDPNIRYNLRAKLNQSLKDIIHRIYYHPDYNNETEKLESITLWITLLGDSPDHVWGITLWKEGRSRFIGRAAKVFQPDGVDDGEMLMKWEPDD